MAWGIRPNGRTRTPTLPNPHIDWSVENCHRGSEGTEICGLVFTSSAFSEGSAVTSPVLMGQANMFGSKERKLNTRIGGEVLVGQSGIKCPKVRISPHGYLKNPPVRLFAVGEGKSPPGSHTPVPSQPLGEDFQFGGLRLPGPTRSEDAFVILGLGWHLGRPQIWADSWSGWRGSPSRLKNHCRCRGFQAVSLPVNFTSQHNLGQGVAGSNVSRERH